MSGPDLPDLRRDYMELTGNPLIPPKKMFGWWLSEYGFENWGEVESKIDALRKNRFPVDGFVMDLQWYGGIARGNSQIGSYSWDLDNFPDPELKFKEYWEEGLGVMMMTETYVDAKIPEFQEFADRGYLAYDSSGITPAVIPYTAVRPVMRSLVGSWRVHRFY